ncbi:MAG: EscU/YscU/HrcU family type III secretion system export apparatus switch protein [Mizugakiibacter sp.]|uniref:EscU/YscU/HrcU family type III secretion system export apparatus switch protein n=1 Tax=Mizugakiibacter sp. TaxID=1972610 RepID=UPI0031CBC17A|nr:EscU/YscU/HrcU family type III secretion system export apparatus switch protein [Xanthomonadaceae bacterium]
MNRDPAAARAVALRYTGQGAPRVTAKADGALVEAMLDLAERHGVPRHRDPALAALLARVELDAEIPPALYAAVAAVLALIYAAAAERDA